MKFCVVAVESQFREDCRTLLAELIPDGFELIASAAQESLPEAEVYVWDFDVEMFSLELNPQIVKRSLFVIEPKLVERFRASLGAMHASVLLKPARRAAFRPFLEHAVRQWRSAQTEPVLASAEMAPGDDHADDLLDCLLHTNLKLQEYDQFRTNFLARAVHDFRAPLTALSGYCELLVDYKLGALNTSQVDLLTRMQHSVKRLSRLADAMFDLSVGRNVKRELDLQYGDVEAAISQAVHEVTPHADEKNIRITVRVDPPFKPLVFDPTKIEQVLINLLENACKFTPKKGTIHVSGYPVAWNGRSPQPSGAGASQASGNGSGLPLIPNAYRIDVRDSGSGVPHEYLESIFEEYTSYTGGTDRSGGGLGLAICRMIMDIHQGSIWAESGPDGALFSVVLPQPEAQGMRLGNEMAGTVIAKRVLSA